MIDKHKAPIGISWEHHLVHHEKMFSSSHNNTVNAGETVALHITTPASERTHIIFEIDVNNAGTILFREGDTITGGSAVTADNMNRESSESYGGTVKKDATVSVAGTTLRTRIIGSSSPSTKIGGNSRQNTEWILKPSTTYTIIFTATNNATTCAINAEYYEE